MTYWDLRYFWARAVGMSRRALGLSMPGSRTLREVVAYAERDPQMRAFIRKHRKEVWS